MSHLLVVGLVLLFTAVRLVYRGTWRPAERSATAETREKVLTTFVSFSLFIPPFVWAGTGFPAALDLPVPLWGQGLGLLLGLLGVGLVERAHAALRENFSPRLDLRPDHTLVNIGPYRWIRHPMYLGGILLGGGMDLLGASAAPGTCLVLAMVLLLTLRVPDEEKMLRDRFGAAWDEHARRTGRILPRWTR